MPLRERQTGFFIKTMGKTRTNKNTLKIIAATSMAIFTLASVFTASFAWFLSNKVQQLDSDGDNFKVGVADGRLSKIYFHKFHNKVLNNGELASYSFEKDYCGSITYDWSSDTGTYIPVVEGDTTIELGKYEPFDPYHPLLLVFELNNQYTMEENEFNIRAKTTIDGFLGARNNDNSPKYNLNTNGVYIDSKTETVDQETVTTYYYALSSIADFYCMDHTLSAFNTMKTADYLTYNVSDLESRDTVKEKKEEDEKKKYADLAFTEVDNDEETSSFNKTPLLYTSEEGASVQYISLIIDYYPDAIEYIYSTYLGNTTLEDTYDGVLHFACDWKMEIY